MSISKERIEEIRRDWTHPHMKPSVHSEETVAVVRELLAALDSAEEVVEAARRVVTPRPDTLYTSEELRGRMRLRDALARHDGVDADG